MVSVAAATYRRLEHLLQTVSNSCCCVWAGDDARTWSGRVHEPRLSLRDLQRGGGRVRPPAPCRSLVCARSRARARYRQRVHELCLPVRKVQAGASPGESDGRSETREVAPRIVVLRGHPWTVERARWSGRRNRSRTKLSRRSFFKHVERVFFASWIFRSIALDPARSRHPLFGGFADPHLARGNSLHAASLPRAQREAAVSDRSSGQQEMVHAAGWARTLSFHR